MIEERAETADNRARVATGPEQGEATVPTSSTVRLRWWARLLNRVRLEICNTLGITHAVRHLHQEHEATAQRMVQVAEQTAHHARLIANILRKHEAWEQEVQAIDRASKRLADDEKNGLMVLRNHRNGG